MGNEFECASALYLFNCRSTKQYSKQHNRPAIIYKTRHPNCSPAEYIYTAGILLCGGANGIWRQQARPVANSAGFAAALSAARLVTRAGAGAARRGSGGAGASAGGRLGYSREGVCPYRGHVHGQGCRRGRRRGCGRRYTGTRRVRTQGGQGEDRARTFSGHSLDNWGHAGGAGAYRGNARMPERRDTGNRRADSR